MLEGARYWIVLWYLVFVLFGTFCVFSFSIISSLAETKQTTSMMEGRKRDRDVGQGGKRWREDWRESRKEGQ